MFKPGRVWLEETFKIEKSRGCQGSFFVFSFVFHWTKGLQRKAESFCIRYFWRTKRKSTETITERCFSCQNKSVCQKLAWSCKKWKSAKIRYTPFLHEGLQFWLECNVYLYHTCLWKSCHFFVKDYSISSFIILIVLTWCLQNQRLTIGSRTCFSVSSNRHMVLRTTRQTIQGLVHLAHSWS